MNVYGVITFEKTHLAESAMKKFEELEKDKQLDMKDAILIVKAHDGSLKVKQTQDATTKRGAVTGGAIGLIIGIVVGGPVGGALLGGAAGAFIGKKADLGIPDERIETVSEAMENASSAILLNIHEEHTNIELLQATIRQYEGEIHQVEVDGQVEVDLNETLNSFTGGSSN